MRLAKANVEQMHTIMSGWSQNPLFRRKEDKKDTLLNLEVYKNVHNPCSTVYMEIFTTWKISPMHVIGKIFT